MFAAMNIELKTKNEPFSGIQALRFLAAFLVLLTHSTFYVSTRVMGGATAVWNDGAQGVPIFFVISGFVMMMTFRSFAAMPAGHVRFMRMRIIPIVPLYWAVNVVKALIWIAAPASMFASFDYWNFGCSLLFLPSENSAGQIEPFYGVGWTLNFEMLFYAIFALAIWWKLRPILLTAPILLCLAAAAVFRAPGSPPVAFYFNPIVLNFLWGILIAEAVGARIIIPAWVAGLMATTGLLLTLLLPAIPLLGVQYALLVGGVVFCESTIARLIPRALIFGGDASYSLYLIHPMIGPGIALLCVKLGIGSWWLAIALMVLVSLVVASAVYTLFERPAGIYLKRRFSA